MRDLKQDLKIKEYTIPFKGYKTDRETLPSCKGIYYVFAAISKDGKVSKKRLLYIGEAQNIYERHNGTKEKPAEHEHFKDFIGALKEGEVVRYAYSELNGTTHERKMIESALIFALDPDINDKSTKSYSGDDILIKIDLGVFVFVKEVQIVEGKDGNWIVKVKK